MNVQIVFRFDDDLPKEAILNYLRNDLKIPIDIDQLEIILQTNGLAFGVDIVKTEKPPVNNN